MIKFIIVGEMMEIAEIEGESNDGGRWLRVLPGDGVDRREFWRGCIGV